MNKVESKIAYHQKQVKKLQSLSDERKKLSALLDENGGKIHEILDGRSLSISRKRKSSKKALPTRQPLSDILVKIFVENGNKRISTNDLCIMALKRGWKTTGKVPQWIVFQALRQMDPFKKAGWSNGNGRGHHRMWQLKADIYQESK